MAAAAILAAGAAQAGLCDNAERGTYLSNVCWLVEGFSQPLFYSQKIRAADEATCTIVLEETGDTIYFNNGDPETIDLRSVEVMNVLCWTLKGDGVADHDRIHFVQKNRFTVCGINDNEGIVAGRNYLSIQKAFKNLYGKYCEGSRREF